MILFRHLKKRDAIFVQNFNEFEFTIAIIYIKKIIVSDDEVEINGELVLPANSVCCGIYSNTVYFSCREALIQKLESDLITIGESAGSIMDTLTALKNNV